MQLHALDRPDLKDTPWPPVTAGRIVAADEAERHLLGHPRPGAAGAPPVRELRQQHRGVHRSGRRRPTVQSHQDDAVPRRRRQPDLAQPDPGRRARRAGGRAGRAQGPLRRGHQRRVGQAARARRRARRVRPGRSEDPLRRSCSSCATTTTGCAATATSAPATTTRGRRGCTRTSGSSRATPTSAPTSTQLFNHLTGYSRRHEYRTLLVAPRDLRHQLLDLIEHEASFGAEGRITVKFNSIVDPR